MKRISLISIIVIQLLGCSKTNVNRIKFTDFPRKVTPQCEEIFVQPVLFMIGGMVLMDDVLITIDLKNDYFFQVFRTKSFEYLGGFVRHGHGPGEEVFIAPYIQQISSDVFQFQTNNSIVRAKFDISDSTLLIMDEVHLPGKLLNFFHTFSLDQNIYGQAPTIKSEREYLGFNPKLHDTFEFGPEYPKLKGAKDIDTNGLIFDKVISVKPDKIRFAAAYDKFPLLRIIDNYGNLISETFYENNQVFPHGLLMENPAQDDLKNVMHNYKKVKSTENYIYALYVGKTTEDFSSPIGLNDFSNEIHVWDWDGKPIMQIILEKEIFSFCVSKDDQHLFCSSLMELDRFYHYSLK